MNTEEFDNLRGWIDEDRGKLHTLTDDEKVVWFERRLYLTLIKPIGDVYDLI